MELKVQDSDLRICSSDRGDVGVFEIDRQKFGAFVARLRREKGYTQKELACRLFISDKAVSKWETGVSIPDTALLVPLSELLGVSVTELLMSERMEKAGTFEPGQVEMIVKRAITYNENHGKRAYQVKSRWPFYYGISLFVGAAGMVLNYAGGRTFETLGTLMGLCAIFGAYFCFFVKLELPRFYDENHVNIFYDGLFRMNMPGVEFNNGNWPHILRAVRVWSCLSMVLFPILHYLLGNPKWGAVRYVGGFILLFMFLGSLFGAIYAGGRKDSHRK